jgi:hypothetical protein
MLGLGTAFSKAYSSKLTIVENTVINVALWCFITEIINNQIDNFYNLIMEY